MISKVMLTGRVASANLDLRDVLVLGSERMASCSQWAEYKGP